MRNPFAAQFASFSQQLDEGLDDAVTTAVAALVADETRKPETMSRLAQLRSVVDKLSRRARPSTAQALSACGRQVQAAQRSLRYEFRDRALAHEVATVRGRVLDLLGDKGPMRPLDLARELDVDPSQVSRALRELRRQGSVRQTAEAPLGDGRGRWYELDRSAPFEERVVAALRETDWTEVRLVGSNGACRVISASDRPASHDVATAADASARATERTG